MNAGFDTIGNATIIAYDAGPVLVTDPWVCGPAYFGSWTLSHEVPEEQRRAIADCSYVWFSHGHPDHLNADSLDLCRGKTILLADHVGGRVKGDLEREGFDVVVLEDRRWHRLSPRIRVLTIADCNQDSILLLDVNGRLVVNLNDASNTGWGRFVKRVIAEFPVSFLLALSGYGDADMIHLFDDAGRPIPPDAAARNPVGRQIAIRLEQYGARYFIPFSSMHRYQRTDSMWAEPYTTKLEDYSVGFDSSRGELLPAFVRFDCETDDLVSLAPRANAVAPVEPDAFGDVWSDTLEPDDVDAVRGYFRSFQKLRGFLDFVNVRVGGVDNVVELGSRQFDRGLTFEAPRASLMTAVRYEVFDDLLIGNFMKTTFHGTWKRQSLYPDFTPYVAKYGDNGRAHTLAELAAYAGAYRRRSRTDALHHLLFDRVHGALEEGTKGALRAFVPVDSKAYMATKSMIRRVVGPTLR